MRDGKLGISVYYSDTLRNFGCDKVRMMIDNESMEVTIAVNPSTIITQIDSLDEKLKQTRFDDVVFRGQLGIKQLSTKGKSPKDFVVEGKLSMHDVTRQIEMSATLSNYQQGPDIESMLYLHFDLLLSEYGFSDELPGFSDEVCIEILQPLLSPTSK
jgi:polyisoprenoid-binding protein YceI